MAKKKLSPPTWDEQNQRWKKTAYCNNMSKTFYSRRRGITGAEKEISAAISEWKSKLQGLTRGNTISPMSRIKDVYPLYIADLQARTSKGNWRPAKSRIEHHILPVIGNIMVMDLNDNVLQNVVNTAYKNSNLSKKTLKNIRNDLNSIVIYCRKSKVTDYRPEDIAIPKSAKRPAKQVLQPEDVRKLFEVDTTIKRGKRIEEEYINAYRLQVLCILRPGEVGGLRKQDRVGNIIRLQRSINIDNEETQGKNENSIRSVIMCPLAQEIWDRQAKMVSGDDLFPGFREKKYRDHFATYCKSNGINYVTPYELRHTSFSILKSLPEGVIRPMGGHSEDMDTYGIYGHQISGDDKMIADMISDRFSKILSKTDF